MLNAQLKALIDDVDVVSFDVFDTLLLRRHYLPADVFSHAGGPEQARFRYLRIAAEQFARRRHHLQQDVSLEQIYAFLKHPPEREIDAERQTLFPNDAARAIYDYAAANGKTIIAVSDMYLPQRVVRESVEQAGYTQVERVYVSCEAGVTKHSGDLFRHVAAELGVAPGRILHIGDNEHADVRRAREQGLRAWYLPSPRARFEAAGLVHPRIVRYLRRGRTPAHSLLLGILRDGLAAGAPEHDYWYRWGFTVAGPVVNAFADWVHERVQRSEHDRLFLFARDGYLPQQVLALRYPQIPTQYTFASRRLFLVPSLEQLDKARLDALCSSLPGTAAREFWTRLGITNAAVEALLESRFAPDARICSADDRKRLEEFFRDAHALMLPDIQRENRILRDYVASIGMSGPSARPLIVDVGWRATSQRFLEKAIPELAGTAGAYFGLSDGAYRNGRMTGWFFDGIVPLQARRLATECVEILELMFSAPHPSIQKIEAAPDGSFTPVYEPATPEEEARIAIVRKVHDGALAFTRLLHERESAGYPIPISADDAVEILHAIIVRPTEEDIRHLGTLPHALGLGSSRYETLLPADLPSNPIQLLRRHSGPSASRLYWPSGLTRAIGLEYGSMRGLASHLAVVGARTVLIARERLSRLLYG